MPRVRRADLDQMVTVAKNMTGDDTLTLDYVDGKPRLMTGDSRYLSPRLSAAEMALWLSGFVEGAEVVKMAGAHAG